MAYTEHFGNNSCPDPPRRPDPPRCWETSALVEGYGTTASAGTRPAAHRLRKRGTRQLCPHPARPSVDHRSHPPPAAPGHRRTDRRPTSARLKRAGPVTQRRTAHQDAPPPPRRPGPAPVARPLDAARAESSGPMYRSARHPHAPARGPPTPHRRNGRAPGPATPMPAKGPQRPVPCLGRARMLGDQLQDIPDRIDQLVLRRIILQDIPGLWREEQFHCPSQSLPAHRP